MSKLFPVLLLITGCATPKPSVIESNSNRKPDEVMNCVMASTSNEGYVPTRGGPGQSFMELTRGRANVGGSILVGQDMAYSEGITIMSLGEGRYQMSVYRIDSNPNKNVVRYQPGAAQEAMASEVWAACMASREECLSIQDDYEQCLDRGGFDPTK